MKIFDFITRDIEEENRDKSVIIALRVLSIICFFAFILDIILAGADAVKAYPFRISFLFFANILVFILTYKIKTTPSLICFVIYVFAWSIAMIEVFGWSGGMQNYYIIILMLCFFANYSKVVYKFIFAGCVLAFRIFTIGIFGGITSNVVARGSMLDKSIQITNITAVYLAIMFLSYFFSKKRVEADGKLIKYNDQLKRESITDQLTGLYNRRRADEYLNELMEERGYESVSISIGDIDFFKKVNDTYGHDIGDVVLRKVSALMKENTRTGTFIARWGGEEFLVVLPDCNGDDAYMAIERLRHVIESTDIEINDGMIIKITMTFGVAELSYVAGLESTIKEADEKLYMGKQGGRNKVVY